MALTPFLEVNLGCVVCEGGFVTLQSGSRIIVSLATK